MATDELQGLVGQVGAAAEVELLESQESGDMKKEEEAVRKWREKWEGEEGG